MSRFDGKVAFVTGATSGIGRATALAFAREGASVVVADVAADGNQETARLIEQAGGQALAVTCDVTRSEDVRAALDAAVERFGRLDIAFNNAGIEQAIKPAARDHRRRMGPPGRRQPPRRVPAHEARDRAHARARRRRDRQHLLGRRRQGLRRPGRLRRHQARRDRPDQVRRARLRRPGHPRQRDLPRDHRHRDDAPLHRRHRRRPRRASSPRSRSAAWARPTRSPPPSCGCARDEAAFTVGHAMVVDGGQTA